MCSLSLKDKRYDRQLRLWGSHGQAALEAAHVCLINATATGTEILKNLVLPGVGSFTVVDKAKVGTQEIGNNFFTSLEDVGGSRARSTIRLLLKLNDVKGYYIEEDIEDVMHADPDFFTRFSVVIATGLPQVTLAKVARLLWSQTIPLLVARSYGLLGYIRLALCHHEIIESHPDNHHEDLRLDCPFPGLKKHMNTLDLAGMNNTKHGNVPFLVIVYKYLQQWKETHSGRIPENYGEKLKFKDLIRSGIRNNEEGVPLDEENFEEAIQNVNGIINSYKIPSSVLDIFENPLCTSITPDSNVFWLLARALHEFVVNEGNGRLPLRGSIPDMISSSDMYIDLCRVYQEQAKADIDVVASHLGQLLISLGRSTNFISENDIKQFCRNSAFLRVLQYRSIDEELNMPNKTTLSSHLEHTESDLVYYILLLAADKFHEMFQAYPGEGTDGMEADAAQMKSIVVSLLQKWSLPTTLIHDDYIVEFCRYGAGEIHSVAAFIGGVAAQEVIKIVTRQYIPLNNTLIYNAATTSTLTVVL